MQTYSNNSGANVTNIAQNGNISNQNAKILQFSDYDISPDRSFSFSFRISPARIKWGHFTLWNWFCPK